MVCLCVCFQNESYTPFAAQLKNSLDELHETWKERQLLGEVLRGQLRHEAINKAFLPRDAEATAVVSIRTDKTIKILSGSKNDSLFAQLLIQHAAIIGMTTTAPAAAATADVDAAAIEAAGSTASRYTLRMSLAQWLCVLKDSSNIPTSLGGSAGAVVWNGNSAVCSGALTLESIKAGQALRIEVHDDSPADLNGSLVAAGSCGVLSLLECNTGEVKTFNIQMASVPRFNEHGIMMPQVPMGTLRLSLKVDEPREEPPDEFDPENLARHEVVGLDEPMPGVLERRIGDSDGPLSAADIASSLVSARPTEHESRAAFADLVASLRGDGIGYVKGLIGDVSLEEVAKISYGDRIVSSAVKVN